MNSGVKPLFSTVKKHFKNAIESGGIVVSSTTFAHGNPNSTISKEGFFYSQNIKNSSVTYRVPLVDVIVKRYELVSYYNDVYPCSWVFEASKDGVNFVELHYSTSPLCEGNKYYVDEGNKWYCKSRTALSFNVKNDNKAYSYFRIKMMTNSASLPDQVNLFLFSNIEIYGVFNNPYKIYYSCKSTSSSLSKFVLFFILTLTHK